MLHTLRLKGVCSVTSVAERTGAGVDALESTLGRYRESGLVTLHRGDLAGWALTAAGRARNEELLTREIDSHGVRSAVELAYRSFLELNQPVLAVCTDWQVVLGSEPLVLNDHTDEAYDASVLQRLDSLHAAALRMLADLQQAVGRFADYDERLGNALARSRSGEVDWVTRPVIDSYHTVWFELHEDMLATLGLRRSDERRRTAGATERTPQGELR